MRIVTLLRRLLPLALFCLVLTGPSDAEAQYKNGQIGFDGGYFFWGDGTGLDQHGFLVALRGAYKATDHWWFSARAGLSFRGEQTLSNNTVIVFHLMPVDVRYYFLTDDFRPYVGVGNAFHFLANHTVPSNVLWGPGALGGVEIRLSRDLFLGLQMDAYWMFDFNAPDVPLLSTTAQLIFFL